MKIAANNPLPTPKISVSLISNLKSEEVHHENINRTSNLGCTVGLLPEEDIRLPKPTAPAGGSIYERLWALFGEP